MAHFTNSRGFICVLLHIIDLFYSFMSYFIKDNCVTLEIDDKVQKEFCYTIVCHLNKWKIIFELNLHIKKKCTRKMETNLLTLIENQYLNLFFL